jgi:hypothetical protein
MQPGDLVRVHPTVVQLAGKIGVVVEETPPPRLRRAYKVLVDGRIYHFYFDYLELVDEAR